MTPWLGPVVDSPNNGSDYVYGMLLVQIHVSPNQPLSVT